MLQKNEYLVYLSNYFGGTIAEHRKEDLTCVLWEQRHKSFPYFFQLLYIIFLNFYKTVSV